MKSTLTSCKHAFRIVASKLNLVFCHCPFTLMLIMDQTICNEYGWAHCRRDTHIFQATDGLLFLERFEIAFKFRGKNLWGSLPSKGPRKHALPEGSVQTHPRSHYLRLSPDSPKVWIIAQLCRGLFELGPELCEDDADPPTPIVNTGVFFCNEISLESLIRMWWVVRWLMQVK